MKNKTIHRQGFKISLQAWSDTIVTINMTTQEKIETKFSDCIKATLAFNAL